VHLHLVGVKQRRVHVIRMLGVVLTQLGHNDANRTLNELLRGEAAIHECEEICAHDGDGLIERGDSWFSEHRGHPGARLGDLLVVFPSDGGGAREVAGGFEFLAFGVCDLVLGETLFVRFEETGFLFFQMSCEISFAAVFLDCAEGGFGYVQR
jgi:hypothetical protein